MVTAGEINQNWLCPQAWGVAQMAVGIGGRREAVMARELGVGEGAARWAVVWICLSRRDCALIVGEVS